MIHRGGKWPLFKAPMLELKALWKGDASTFGSAYNCAIGDTVTAGKPTSCVLRIVECPGRIRGPRQTGQGLHSVALPLHIRTQDNANGVRLSKGLGINHDRGASCCCKDICCPCRGLSVLRCHISPRIDLHSHHPCQTLALHEGVSDMSACCRPGAGGRLL